MNILNNSLDIEVEKIRVVLLELLKNNQKIFVSSSFQTHSIPLLHIISEIDKNIPIYFLQTGYHFPETMTYKDEIGEKLGLKITNLYSPIIKNAQKDKNGQFYFCSNSNYCCHINKVIPLEPILLERDIWISGVRRDQSAHRKSLEYFLPGPSGTKRYHPMLDWTSKLIWEYRKRHDLPSHPLESKGYFSVGCAPCTKSDQENERQGRWFGQKKEECGLHITLLGK